MSLNTRLLTPLFLATASLMPLAAQAGDSSLVTRAATGVGRVIAAQGNAAFQQIRADFLQELQQKLRPQLPAREALTSAAAAEPALEEYLSLHQQARTQQ